MNAGNDVSFEIFCDFDGTITKQDCTDLLLDRLADPAWLEVEADWVAGKIGSRDCLAGQIALIRGGWLAIEKTLSEISVADGFAEFVRWCQSEGIRLTLVSDGIDRVIDFVLKRESLTVDAVFANHLNESGGNLFLTFPYGQAECASGVCKCKLVEPGASIRRRVVIGDGRSDFCWAKHADVLFAKSKLALNCEQEGIPFFPFEDFHDIRQQLINFGNLAIGQSASRT